MTDEQLATISKRAQMATAGPWFPVITDDQLFQGAVYVAKQARGKDNGLGFYLDGGRGKKLMAEGKIDAETVVAITCLQSPELVYQDECDSNALFIAHAREDVPTLVSEIYRLRALLEGKG